MKLRLAAAAAVGALALSYGLGIRGLDGPLSQLVSLRAGLSIRLSGTRLERLSRVRFDRADILSPGGRSMAQAGAGLIRLRGAGRIDGRVDTLTLTADALARLPGITQGARLGPVRFTLRSRGDRQTLHLTALSPDRAWALCGITLVGGTPVKAHGWLFASDASARIPEEVSRRLYRKGDMRGLRFLLARRTLTAFGHAGPFFEMRWSN